jgi:hypothetical protein
MMMRAVRHEARFSDVIMVFRDAAATQVTTCGSGHPRVLAVEVHGTPKIVVCSLSRGRYVAGPRWLPEPRAALPGPFLVELDPADLTRRFPKLERPRFVSTSCRAPCRTGPRMRASATPLVGARNDWVLV